MSNKHIAPSGYSYVKSSGGIAEYRLKSNGLRVLIMEEHSAPVATVMVTYHVGSRNEAVGYTGATHLLEHLMFKGSKNYNKKNKRDVWSLFESRGARINATTWLDRTNYFETFPVEFLEDSIGLEADRMRNAFLIEDDRQREMSVVRNEYERGENDPIEALDKSIWATAYQAHPYHHPTIGWREDIENVSIERLREFYNTFYWPNNATVTVIGDVDTKKTFELIKKHFGKHKASPHEIPQVYTEEPNQEGPRRVIVRRSGETGIVGVAHKTPRGLDRDTYALQVLMHILDTGKASRLYTRLVDSGLAIDVSILNTPFHDNGLFSTYVVLAPGTSHEEIERLILEEYEEIKKNGVKNEEVERAQARITAEASFARDGSYAMAAVVNESIALGDWTFATTFKDRILKVSPVDVQNAAKKFLLEDQSTSGWFVPKRVSVVAAEYIPPMDELHGPSPLRPLNDEIDDLLWTMGPAPTVPISGKNRKRRLAKGFSQRIHEDSPIEGIKVFSMKTGVKDAVTIAGSFLGGRMFSPKENPLVADFIVRMLDQDTLKTTKTELRQQLESVGASLEFSCTDYRVEFRAACMKKDLPLVLRILAEQLQEPGFISRDVEIVRKRLIGELERAREDTNLRARTLFLQALFPDTHPNYEYDIESTIRFVEVVTSADLKAFHEKYYGLGAIQLVAVGDVQAADINASVLKEFARWRTWPLSITPISEHASLGKKSLSYELMREKTSVDLYIGQAIGIDRKHPDYYPLMLGFYILGGTASSRLFVHVRDQQGLTYGTYSRIEGVDDGADGYWFAWGTFAPTLLKKGEQAILKELTQLVAKGVTRDELASKKATIRGGFAVGLATTGGLAETILNNAEQGRPKEFLDQFLNIIDTITLPTVNAAIRKYIDLKKFALVAAGSVDAKGKAV